MAVEGGAKCVKYLLFFFNFIFWLCGLAMIVLGIMVKVSFQNLDVIKGYTGPPLVLIVVGVIIFFIAFFGCCGAWKENQCMVTMFAILLSLILIAEIGIAITGYVYRGKLSELLNTNLKEMISGYNKTEDYRTTIDFIQKDFHCCGGNSSSDWGSFSTGGKSVPDSCCKNITKNCGANAMGDANKIYTDGCEPIVEKLLKEKILWVAVGALVIAFIQLTGIVLACVLMRAIRSGYEVM